MFDLGDTVVLTYRLVDDAGQPVSAATASITITQPDGTTVDATPAEPEPGDYRHEHVTTMAGRHTVRWVFTGPADAHTDVFNVAAAAPVALIGLADAKRALRMKVTDTSLDVELRSLVDALTAVVEEYVGAVVRRTVTERRSGGRSTIALDHGPVLEITTVTESGTVVDPSGYSHNHGTLTRLAGSYPGCWLYGVDNVEVVYVVGRVAVAPHFVQACEQLVRVNARPLLGGTWSDYDEETDAAGGEWRNGFWVPRGVIALLSGEPQPVGIG